MKNNNLKNGSTPLTTGAFTISLIIAIIVLIAVIGGVFYFAVKQRSTVKKGAIEKSGAMMEKKESESMVKKEGEMMKYSGAVLAGKASLLLDFNKSDYDSALKTDKLIVLYFYANWCPICKTEFPLMRSAFNGLTIDKVVGFRVNYNDNQTDNDEKNLAKEFGVAYQHTKVFIKNGERVLKSPEGWDKNRYLSEITNINST